MIRLLFLWEIPIYVADEEKIKVVTEQINIVTASLPLKNMHIMKESSDILWYVRIAVTLGLAMYVCVMYIMNYLRLSDALPVENNVLVSEWLNKNKWIRPIIVKQSDKVFTPLTYGVFTPRIILPRCLQYENGKNIEYILLHEKIHITRFDSIWKLLSFITICVHWFNPFVWLLYYMFSKDMENACDEKVISILGEDKREEYAEMLIRISQQKARLYTTSACFGYRVIRERIVTIMKYKKRSAKNKICTLLLALSFSLGTSFTAFAAEENVDTKVIKSVTEQSLLDGTYTTGLFTKSVKKTVKKNYVKDSDVDVAIDYSEYIDGAWYVGRLYRTGDVVVLSTGLYQATYSGKIYKQ